MSEFGAFDGPQSGSIEELSEPHHPSLRQLHAYWQSKKGTQIAPSRSAILPEEIVAHLPHVALVDVIGDPLRFRFRLFGSALVAAYGQDLTGKFLDEIDFGAWSISEIAARATKVVRDCKMHVGRMRFTKKGDNRRIEYERILLPLSNDGSTVSMILCGYVIEKAYG
jgi:hypothetical protein